MNQQLSSDLGSLNSLVQAAMNNGMDFLNRIDEIPTTVKVPEQGPSIMEEGKGGEKTLEEFRRRFQPLMVAATGPRYWGFVTGGSTPAALMGDLLAGMLDQNTQTVSGQGDVSGIVEWETGELLKQFFQLPAHFMAACVTGATMSNFTCLAVARQWLADRDNHNVALDGLYEKPAVLSATPHSSAIKALAMLGMGSRNITRVSVQPGREAIDLSALEAAIAKLEGKPFILISSAATVNTADFDNFEAIAALRDRYSFWWHIDAAFGGFAALSPGHQHWLRGWEGADSITIDGHKWLNVPYENAFYFIHEKHRLHQVATFQNASAPYLGDPMEQFNYLNFLPENSRRFRALPVWFTLKAYGREGYREVVERNIRCARALGNYIEQSPGFRLLAPVRLNTVCFTLSTDANGERVRQFLTRLNAGGKVFMTPTRLNGIPGIRAALVNWRTMEHDVDMAIAEMEKALAGF